jgi:hypothetical protein
MVESNDFFKIRNVENTEVAKQNIELLEESNEDMLQ